MAQEKNDGVGGRAVAAIAGAAIVTGLAVFNNTRAGIAEEDRPPLGRTVTVDGVDLHYVERGDGPLLLLVHGNGTSIEDWQASGLLDRLAERYRVIAFDRPGFGHSSRPRTRIWTPEAQAALIATALRGITDEPAIVVGHSWGTLVALSLALQHPSVAGSLVLLGGYYFPTNRLDAPLLGAPALPIIGDLMRHTISPLLAEAVFPKIERKIFAPAEVPPSFREAVMPLAIRPSQLQAEAADSALMIPAAARLSRRYAELDLPVAIAAGAGDALLDAEANSRALNDAIPGSTLRLVEGAGHMIHWTAPDAVMEIIDSVASRPLQDA